MTLLTPDGRFDRAAILRDARRQFLAMGRHGWSWRQCVRYSWTRGKAERDRDGTACAMETMRQTILANRNTRNPLF
jgi:hypothetical protein